MTDYVIDQKCKLVFEQFKGGSHENDFYGDINTINGIPFPQMDL